MGTFDPGQSRSGCLSLGEGLVLPFDHTLNRRSKPSLRGHAWFVR
jgi:hypothetical protein